MNAPRMTTGSSSKEKDESGMNDDIEESYKLFKLHVYKVRGRKGEFMCPFCACKEEADYRYSNLLQHSIRVAVGSLDRMQRAKHYAMARYLAFDLAAELKEVADAQTATGRKRSRPSEDVTKKDASIRKRQPNGNLEKLAMAEKREKEAQKRVRELESKLEDTTDQLNALITKDRLSNDELQGVRRELIKGLDEIKQGKHGEGDYGIKRLGELDPDDFTNELRWMFRGGEVEMKSVELCSIWQDKMKDPHWYPFQIYEDYMGMPQRAMKDDDVSLQALKEEYGQGICDAVVKALTELQDHNPSGCYVVPELWNFGEERKAELHEVITHIFELLAAAKANKKTRTQPSRSKCC